jgi:hypothetical protein
LGFLPGLGAFPDELNDCLFIEIRKPFEAHAALADVGLREPIAIPLGDGTRVVGGAATKRDVLLVIGNPDLHPFTGAATGVGVGVLPISQHAVVHGRFEIRRVFANEIVQASDILTAVFLDRNNVLLGGFGVGFSFHQST